MKRLLDVKKRARQYIDEFPDERIYHDETHILRVASVSRELASARALTIREEEILVTAAWFHDIGYANGPMDGHEQRSIELMHRELADLFTEGERARIEAAIQATEWPQTPKTEIGCILADADVHSLGTERAPEMRQSIYEELTNTDCPDLGWEEYLERRINWFDDFEYHTSEARARYQAKKDAHIAELKRQLV